LTGVSDKRRNRARKRVPGFNVKMARYGDKFCSLVATSSIDGIQP